MYSQGFAVNDSVYTFCRSLDILWSENGTNMHIIAGLGMHIALISMVIVRRRFVGQMWYCPMMMCRWRSIFPHSNTQSSACDDGYYWMYTDRLQADRVSQSAISMERSSSIMSIANGRFEKQITWFGKLKRMRIVVGWSWICIWFYNYFTPYTYLLNYEKPLKGS